MQNDELRSAPSRQLTGLRVWQGQSLGRAGDTCLQKHRTLPTSQLSIRRSQTCELSGADIRHIQVLLDCIDKSHNGMNSIKSVGINHTTSVNMNSVCYSFNFETDFRTSPSDQYPSICINEYVVLNQTRGNNDLSRWLSLLFTRTRPWWLRAWILNPDRRRSKLSHRVGMFHCWAQAEMEIYERRGAKARCCFTHLRVEVIQQ